MELQVDDVQIDGAPTIEGIFDEELPEGKFHLLRVEMKLLQFTVRLSRDDIQQLFQAAFGG